jgi:enterobactin synthetase component D / holo-[acyl-carrier protein] synthase
VADVLGEILPPQVAVVETFDDPPDVQLYPEEEALLRKAVASRRQEFGTTRWCARQALAKLGLPPAAILPGPRRAPRWPDGVVGSMTHCAGYRAAALAHVRDIAAIGIDAEPHEPLPDGVRDVVVGRKESPALAELMTAEPGTSWDKLLFSAKESVYKAWFPLTERWLGFKDAAVSIDPADGTFTAALLVPGPVLDGRELTEFSGRWLARNGLVITSVTVPGLG